MKGRNGASRPARQRRALAHRGDRRHLRRLDRRSEPGHERDTTPISSEMMTVRGATISPVVGRSLFTALKNAFRPTASTDPGEQPDDRSEQPDHERLDADRGQELAPGGADRPQRRELADPLRDRDRERVEDDERSDEERDRREREQEVLDDLRERRRLLRPPSTCCARVRTVDLVQRHDLLDLRDELLRRDAGLRRDRDRVELPFAVEELLGRRAS